MCCPWRTFCSHEVKTAFFYQFVVIQLIFASDMAICQIDNEKFSLHSIIELFSMISIVHIFSKLLLKSGVAIVNCQAWFPHNFDGTVAGLFVVSCPSCYLLQHCENMMFRFSKKNCGKCSSSIRGNHSYL